MRALGMVAVLLLASPALAADFQPVRSVTVTGFAQKKVVPDEAHIVVNLRALDMKLVGAKSLHDAKLQKLMSIVAKAHIPEKKVATQSSNVQPIISYSTDPVTHENKQHFDGYQVQSSIDITVEDTGKLGDLQDAIMGAGFEDEKSPQWGNMVNMYYTISNPQKLREDMLVDAIANAKSKATRMAAAADVSVARVLQMTEGGSAAPSFPVPMMAMERASQKMASADSIAPPAGEQEMQSTVTVTYEIQ